MTITIKASNSRRSPKKNVFTKSVWAKTKPSKAKAKSFKSTKTNLADDAPYARSLLSWLKKDDLALKQAIESGLDLFSVASSLEREPMTVIERLHDVGLFEFDLQSPEHLEIASWLLSGVSMDAGIRWCRQDPQRLSWSALDAQRTHADPRAAIEVAWEHGLWRLTVADLGDLHWLAEKQPANVAKAVGDVRAAFDAPTPATVRRQLSGAKCVAVPQSFWSKLEATQMAEEAAPSPLGARRPVAVVSTSPISRKRHSPKPSSRRNGSTYKRGGKSPSVPYGATPVDTRTAAERAWESRDTW